MTTTWPEAVSDLCKLGGGVVVACFALWLVIPAQTAQTEALLDAMKADRELVNKQVNGLNDKLDSILLKLKGVSNE